MRATWKETQKHLLEPPGRRRQGARPQPKLARNRANLGRSRPVVSKPPRSRPQRPKCSAAARPRPRPQTTCMAPPEALWVHGGARHAACAGRYALQPGMERQGEAVWKQARGAHSACGRGAASASAHGLLYSLDAVELHLASHLCRASRGSATGALDRSITDARTARGPSGISTRNGLLTIRFSPRSSAFRMAGKPTRGAQGRFGRVRPDRRRDRLLARGAPLLVKFPRLKNADLGTDPRGPGRGRWTRGGS